MAVRPIWRGHLRLALVSCPVALYNARHDRASIRFHLINPDTGNRIRMITQDVETGKESDRRDLVKGYEFRKDQYLILSDKDFDSVKVESSAVMTVEKFVDADSIDPVYSDAAYYLAPDGDAGRDVYAVLRQAIAKTGKVALSRPGTDVAARASASEPALRNLLTIHGHDPSMVLIGDSVRRRHRGVRWTGSVRCLRLCNSPTSQQACGQTQCENLLHNFLSGERPLASAADA
jgi:hypothetical protein